MKPAPRPEPSGTAVPTLELLGRRSRAARRLQWRALLVAALVALLIAVFSAADALATRSSVLERQLDGLGQLTVPGLTDAAWSFDLGQMQAQLRALAKAPDVAALRLVQRGQADVLFGQPPADADRLERRFDLQHEEAGRRHELGTLVLMADLSADRHQVLRRVALDAVTGALLLLAGAWLSVLTYQRTVRQRLQGVARELRAVTPEDLLAAPSAAPARPSRDEFDDLSAAVVSLKARGGQGLREVAEKNALLRDLMAAIPDLVWLKDTEGVYLACNPAFERLYGAPEAAIVGRTDHDFVDPVLADFFRAHDRAAIAAGGPSRNEEELTFKADGYRGLFETTKVPLRAADGAVMGVLGIAHDISERQRSQQALQDHRDELEAKVAARTRELEEARGAAESANRAKSAFLANMSHEIRTPLAAITGMASLLRRGGLNPAQQDRLDKLEAAGAHLLELINMVLDLSKIEAEKLVLADAPVHVHALLGNVLSMVGERAHAKGLQLRSRVDLPPLALRGDPTRLQQALLNYTGNAVKFTSEGSVELAVSLERDEGETVLLRFDVTDTGPGIAEAEQARLFNAFEQIDESITRSHGGTGLGLAITRRLAQLMGGSTGVHSQAGAGSRFWFTARLRKETAVSIEPVDAHELPAEAVGQAEARLRQSHRGRRVLLVDDEAVNREIAQTLLAEAGLEVLPAVHGAQALARLHTATVDLVLMDMQMPVMDGLEATRRLRALPQGAHLPVIAMTANAFNEDRERCLAAGMTGFLAKPFSPEDLFEAVLQGLEGRATA